MDAVEMTADVALAAEDAFPLVTFALFAYNQEKYIREAVEGALAQDYPNLEVIISDDCSTDLTFEIMKQIAQQYTGPHRIVLNRNDRNLGIGRHIDQMVASSSGRFMVVAAGDDVSRQDRVSTLVAVWRGSPGCVAVCSDAQVINDAGQAKGIQIGRPFEGTLANGVACYFAGVQGCCFSWDKQLFDAFGSFQPGTVCEDRVLPLRSALLGYVAYVQEPLVKYRVHGRNVSHFFKTEPEKVIERTIEIHRRNMNILENYIADLGKQGAIRMQSPKAVSDALEEARRMVRSIQAKLQFLEGNLLAKLRVVVSHLHRDPAQCMRWLVIMLFPGLYVRNQMKNFGVR